MSTNECHECGTPTPDDQAAIEQRRQANATAAIGAGDLVRLRSTWALGIVEAVTPSPTRWPYHTIYRVAWELPGGRTSISAHSRSELVPE